MPARWGRFVGSNPKKTCLDDRGQTSTEYLILVAIGTLVVVIAVAGLFHLGMIIEEEYNRLKEYQDAIIEVLLK